MKVQHREVVEEGKTTVIIKSWTLTRLGSGTYGCKDEADMQYELITRKELWLRELENPEYLTGKK